MTANADELPDRADGRGDGVTRDESGLLHHRITRVIIGAFYNVHSQLGSGFLESVYANALSVVLRNANIRLAREVPFEVRFHGERIGRFRADLVVDDEVIVEVKAGRRIDPASGAQLLNYLRASGLSVGLLLNFGSSAEFKRIISTARAGSAVSVSRSA